MAIALGRAQASLLAGRPTSKAQLDSVLDRPPCVSLAGKALARFVAGSSVRTNHAAPYPLTTLGQILLRQAERRRPMDPKLFEEAFELLKEAMQLEQLNRRIKVQPFMTLLVGAARYLDQGGVISPEHRLELQTYAAKARGIFADDPGVKAALERLDRALRIK